MRLQIAAPFCALALFALTGCGIGPTQQQISQDVSSESFRGTIFGGQQPVKHAEIEIFAIGSSGYGSSNLLTQTTQVYSDDSGNFSIPADNYTCPQSDTPVYLVAVGGDSGSGANPNIMLAASIGLCGNTNQTVNINEVTTAATAYAMAQFFSPAQDSFGGPSTSSSGVITYSVGLSNAALYTVPTLVNLAQGTANTSTSALTLPSSRLNSIADILAACVNSLGGAAGDASNCGTLFQSTTAPGSTTAPTNTLEAAVNMALYPYQNVSTLFGLQNATPPFVGLSTTPTDWTLPIAYTNNLSSVYNTGLTNYVPDLEIDAFGQVWFPGTAGPLQYNPGATALSTFFDYCGTTTPLLHQAFSAQNQLFQTCSKNDGSVFVMDGTSSHTYSFNFYISDGSNRGNPTYPRNIAMDSEGNAVFFLNNFSGGTGIYQVPVNSVSSSNPYPSATQKNTSGFTSYPYYFAANSFGEVASTTSSGGAMYWDLQGDTAERTATFSSSFTSGTAGGYAEVASGDTLGVSTGDNKECDYFDVCTAAGYNGMNQPTGVAVDGNNNIWVANAGNNSVSEFAFTAGQVLVAIGNYAYDSTVAPQPTSIAIDQSGDVWFNNQGDSSSTTLTEIVGAAGPTIQPIVNQITGGNFSGSKPTN